VSGAVHVLDGNTRATAEPTLYVRANRPVSNSSLIRTDNILSLQQMKLLSYVTLDTTSEFLYSHGKPPAQRGNGCVTRPLPSTWYSSTDAVFISTTVEPCVRSPGSKLSVFWVANRLQSPATIALPAAALANCVSESSTTPKTTFIFLSILL